MFVVFVLGILGDRVLFRDAFGDLPVEFREFAVLLLKQFFDIKLLIAGKFAKAVIFAFGGRS